MSSPKHIALLGSTGSIGRQCLKVVDAQPEDFVVEVLAGGNQIELLIEQALRYRPNVVVVGNDDAFTRINDVLWDHDIKVYAGEDALAQVVEMEAVDMVVNALIGTAGLMPSIHSIRAGKTLALAHKETMVMAGAAVAQMMKTSKSAIIPIDSEASAIFQCLTGEGENKIKKVLLTASGGPFLNRDHQTLSEVTVKEATDHPVWKMGAHISVDSATLMNKGMETIELQWLFGLQPDQIEIVIHPEAIVHSMVQFEDGQMKAQLGEHNMMGYLSYALNFPRRRASTSTFNLLSHPSLHFNPIRSNEFPCLQLALDAARQGGNLPCALSVANEYSVQAFLKGQIGFTDIPTVIEQIINGVQYTSKSDLDTIQLTIEETRSISREILKNLNVLR